MRRTRLNDIESHTVVQDKLIFLFAEMLRAPQKSKHYLTQTLADIETAQRVTHPFPIEFKIRALKSHYKQQARYIRIFPNVFTQITANASYVAGWRAKLMLKWAGLPFTVGADNCIHLKTVSYTKISLFLQMLIYLSENETAESSELIHSKPSSTAVYLNQQLGPSFSQGQYIDFVDRLYDQYKHTKLSPYVFRHMFRCFGCHTPAIANVAFDHYIQLRNTENAWQLAVADFLQNHLSLPKPIAQSVAKLLLHSPSMTIH